MQQNKHRTGLTLLELIIATTMMTMLMVSVSAVLRSSRVAWDAREADCSRLESAYGLLRHLVRWVRQANEIVSVSSPTNTSGYITMRLPSGDVYAWRHDSTGKAVYFGIGSANDLLAENIESLTFEAFKADGVTPTTDVDAIQCLRVTVGFRLPRDTGSARLVRSWVMIRAW